MENPIISICVPSYRRPKEIQELIDSVVDQFDGTIDDRIELIISDDGGSNIESAILPYLEKYPQIRYVRNEKNMRFANGLIANSLGKGKYLLALSNDDCLTEFSLRYLLDIIEKTDFDFLLHKPMFTADISVPVPKTPNTYTVYEGVHAYIDGLYEREKTYNGLVSYFSFNSVMVTKASYRKDAYTNVPNKEIMFASEFPQEFPPYYDLRDKKIVLTDATFLKGRLLNASYKGSRKLVHSFQETMDYIEKQNDLSGSASWKQIKRICVSGRNRTMYIAMLLEFFRLDYKTSGLTRRLYKMFKKHVQK